MKIFIAVLLIITLLSACNSNKKESKPEPVSNSEFIGFRDKAIKIVPNLKSSHDLVLFFEMIEVPFKPELVNHNLNYNKYSESNLLAAANMGIYFADAMYQKSYGKKVGADSSIMAAVKLSKTLGLNEVFEELAKVNERADMMPIDSLIYKMDESLMQAEYILAENERMQIYIAMLTGNYIQKQYLLLSLIVEYPQTASENTKVSAINELLFVLGQFKGASRSLVELIEKYKPTDGSGFLVHEINTYNQNLQSLNIDVMLDQSASMKAESPTLKNMHSSINSMRSYIIQ